MNTRPESSEYAPYYERYVSLVKENDVFLAMKTQYAATSSYIRTLPESFGGYRYAPDKWSVKEVIGHVIDTEKVFSFRALFFARAAKVSLPGFEQNDWVTASDFSRYTFEELCEEYSSVRKANLSFFGHLRSEDWLRRGIANNNEISVRALGAIIVGHERHHLEILKTRYR